jgi:hypothetical protein
VKPAGGKKKKKKMCVITVAMVMLLRDLGLMPSIHMLGASQSYDIKGFWDLRLLSDGL